MLPRVRLVISWHLSRKCSQVHRNWLAVLSVEGGKVEVPIRAPFLSVFQIDQEQNSATGRARVPEASGLCSRDPREPRLMPVAGCVQRGGICMLSVHSATGTAGKLSP